MVNDTSSRTLRQRWTPLLRLGLRLSLLLALSGAGFLFQSPRVVQAQEPRRCFGDEAPAVTACIEGGFLSFWEENGGLAVFGYPLTDIRTEQTEDGTFLTQYFERARFELHPENEPPYDVQLGRLGVHLLHANGLSLNDFPEETPIDSCDFWDETQHNVCEPFLTAWRSAGVQLDGDADLTESEHLALWGLPVTGQVPVTTDSGVVLTQWFERARFEQQPNGTITFGLLGTEILGGSPRVPLPPAEPEPEPEPEPGAPAPPPSPAPSTPPSAPTPGYPCNLHDPAPAEGLQAWMADPTPARGEDAVTCARLILNGNVVNGAQAMAYRYIGDERRPSIPQSTGLDGMVGFIFYTGEDAPGVTIPVEVVVTHRGQTYSAFTAYTPQ